VTLTAGVLLSSWIAMSSWQPATVQADSATVCPSTEPLMESLCGAAEHSSKMFALLRAGDVKGAGREAELSSTYMTTFSTVMNMLTEKMRALQAQVMNGIKP
jgi:hypothetical protein